MKIAKKLLAVVMTLAMVAAMSAMAFAATPAATFTVSGSNGEYTVSVKLADCVGLTSGSLDFGYTDGEVTEITSANGADVKAIALCNNSFSKDFNNGVNPAKYAFYFKESLSDSATWAKDGDVMGTVNGENFEATVLTIKGTAGATITVTGELKFGDNATAVDTSFTLGKVEPKPCEHALDKVDAVAATCTAAGVKEYYKCSKCGKLFSDAAGTTEIAAPEAIAKLEHKWVETERVEATKEADGYVKETCSACGEVKVTVLPKLGSRIILDVDPNNNGISFVCSCGDKNCKCQNKDCKCCDAKAADKGVCGDKNCKCNAAADAAKADAAKTNTAKAGVKTDGGKNTGDNGVIAIVAGVMVLAGAAYVATKKRK